MITDKLLYPEKAAFISTSGVFLFKQFDEVIELNKNILNRVRGRKVALKQLDSLSLAILIPVLESVAETVLILPKGLDDSEVESMIIDTNVEFTVSLDKLNINMTAYNHNELSAREIAKNAITKWGIPTSGTTGKPKLVMHTLQSLTRTVVTNFQKGADNVWGLTYEISRFAGLQVYFQALLGNCTLILPNDDAGIKDKALFFVKNRITALSATPSFWRSFLMVKNVKLLLLKRITLGGEISNQNILNALKVAFPLAKIVHIYASTEAGVGFSVTDGIEGFPLDFCRSGIKDVALKIDNENCLLIKSSCNQQSYFSGRAMYDGDGFVNTGDVVEIEGDRVLFLGRDSGAINVGGNKVHPEEVESVILQHPEIELCRVKGQKNPIMGSLVVAEVLTKSEMLDFKSLKVQLSKLCKEQLESFKVPFKFVKVDVIETSSAGKVVRRKV